MDAATAWQCGSEDGEVNARVNANVILAVVVRSGDEKVNHQVTVAVAD
ncbi:MAG: hypothetical protein ACRD0V_15190 [Acidimicrobiales bacterium]